MDTNAAIPSAIGPAYMIPSIPKNTGKIRIRGSKKIICLVRDKNSPLFGFPMDEKKFEVSG